RASAGRSRPTGARAPAGREGRRASPSRRLAGLGDDARHQPGVLVEELLRQGVPALEVLVHGEQVGHRRVRVRWVVRTLDLADVDAVDDRAEALQGELALARGAQDELQ